MLSLQDIEEEEEAAHNNRIKIRINIHNNHAMHMIIKEMHPHHEAEKAVQVSFSDEEVEKNLMEEEKQEIDIEKYIEEDNVTVVIELVILRKIAEFGK